MEEKIIVKTSFDVAIMLWKIANELDPFCNFNCSEADAIKEFIQLTEEENIKGLNEQFVDVEYKVPHEVINILKDMSLYLENENLLNEIINKCIEV